MSTLYIVQDNHPLPYALTSACAQGNLALARLLLREGAQVDYHHMHYDYRPNNPIEVAARHGHLDIVQLLLEHGAPEGPALYNAAMGGQTHVVKWLCKRDRDVIWLPMEKHGEQPVGSAALMCALQRLNRPIIEALTDAGISLDRPNGGDAHSPFYDTKRYNRPNEIKLLLSLGAINVTLAEEEMAVDPSIRQSSGEVYVTERTWEWAGKY